MSEMHELYCSCGKKYSAHGVLSSGTFPCPGFKPRPMTMPMVACASCERLTLERDEARLYAENADITALLSRCYACGHRHDEGIALDECPRCGEAYTCHPWELPAEGEYPEICGCTRCVKERGVTS